MTETALGIGGECVPEEICSSHRAEIRRIDERCEDRKRERLTREAQQDDVNRRLTERVEQIDSKLNWILGASFILWPLLQVLVPYLLRLQGVK